ncbi:MAG: ThiF family adenylyltransferase, partial [Flavobacteriaceae bacterium]|nr:ThiF family adenylyltransferase [Flavobacteriaceae bacterium]
IGYFQKNYCEISKYSIVGETLKIISNSSKSKENFDTQILKMYDRQLGFIKEDDFVGIKNLHIAIVGCGGIGSPLAVMLAKMGVKKISLFDDDKIEIHNLPRIYGADESDIGKFKTEVLKDHINSFSNCEVKTYNIRVDENIADFYNCDVIYGCLDNYQARSTLNKFSYTLATPYIDAGCAIPLDEDTIINAATSVTVVMPTKACLWCADIINGMKIREESLTTEEHSRQVDEGYIQGVNSVPSVISLTTAVASAAANRLFNILGIYNSKIPMRTVYDFNFDKKFDYHYDKKEKCFCTRSPI